MSPLILSHIFQEPTIPGAGISKVENTRYGEKETTSAPVSGMF